MWVKICGTTSLGDAQLAVKAGADALGFIFAPSKRRVSVEQAASIIAQLPAQVEKVGVVTEHNPGEIVRLVQGAGLTALQLHMNHQPGLTQELRRSLGERVKLIQVIAVAAEVQDAAALRASLVEPLRAALADPSVWAVLLDTAKAGVSGGTGTTFAWEIAKPAIREAIALAMAEVRRPVRLVLAGGLNADNVAEAIAVLSPWGVDVVSGVESGPGHKDPDRLAAFFASARAERKPVTR